VNTLGQARVRNNHRLAQPPFAPRCTRPRPQPTSGNLKPTSAPAGQGSLATPGGGFLGGAPTEPLERRWQDLPGFTRYPRRRLPRWCTNRAFATPLARPLTNRRTTTLGGAKHYRRFSGGGVHLHNIDSSAQQQVRHRLGRCRCRWRPFPTLRLAAPPRLRAPPWTCDHTPPRGCWMSERTTSLRERAHRPGSLGGEHGASGQRLPLGRGRHGPTQTWS
jgi:hypothetical protein